MNPEKLRRMQEQVRTGGKGSVRRKRKAPIKTTVRRRRVPVPARARLRRANERERKRFCEQKKSFFFAQSLHFFALALALTARRRSGHG